MRIGVTAGLPFDAPVRSAFGVVPGIAFGLRGESITRTFQGTVTEGTIGTYFRIYPVVVGYPPKTVRKWRLHVRTAVANGSTAPANSPLAPQSDLSLSRSHVTG